MSLVSEEDGIPYFVGKDEEWTQYKIQTLTLKTGQQIQYDGKNPIQKLNELYKGIVYKCTEPEGPFKAANLFRVTVEVEGQEYEGMANSKKSAKLSAASAALESLAITGILSMREEQLGTLRVERNEKQRQMMQRLREAQVAHGGPLWPKKKPLEERGFPGPVNPCTRLNERFKSAQYKIVGQLGEYPNTQFTVQCVVQGVSYLGAGRSKKIAKYNAAEKAMRARNIWTEQDEHLKKQRLMEDGKTYKNPPEPRRQRGARRGGVRGGMFTGGQDGGMGRGGRGGFRGGAMGGAMGVGRGGAAGAMGRGVGTGFRGARGAGVRGGTRGGARGGGATGGFGAQGSFGAGGAGGVGSGGMNPGFKFNQGGPQGGFKFGASNQGGGGKPFKSVLSQQWTNFRKAGELGSGGVTFNPPPPPQKPRPTQSAPVSTGYNSMAQNTAQYQQQSQENTDFTSDNYSYDNSNQQQEPYSYGYGTMDNTQQQNFNYAASAYTAGYQNPNYGYGYGGYGTDMYAQGHSY